MFYLQLTDPSEFLKHRSLAENKGWYWYFRIPDFETPKDRMVQLVRWYLSAFHAGRNSEIAKKPYNPILGETFTCFWKLPGNEHSGVSENSGVSLSWRFSFIFIFTGVNFYAL